MAFLICLGLCTMPLQANADETLLAGRVLLPDGSLQSDAVVVVADGVVKRIGKTSEFAGRPVQKLSQDVVISPGMIDLFATPSVVGQTVEDTELIEPEASPVDVLDATHKDFRQALESGITSVMVGPSATNLVCGVCVTVRTHVDGQLELLRRDGPLLLAFGPGVWRSDRAPTSRTGATLALTELVAKARRGEAHPRINAAMAGELDAWIVCTAEEDVLAVRKALGNARNRFGLVLSKDAIELASTLKGTGRPVVMGPYSQVTAKRELLGARALSEAGLEVAFRAGFPAGNAAAMRLTAALAVRSGMDPAAARRAITIAPAKVAGVEKRVGSIALGKAADLVLFSNDPLRMDARVLEVYVRGQRVFSAQHQNLTGGGTQP